METFVVIIGLFFIVYLICIFLDHFDSKPSNDDFSPDNDRRQTSDINKNKTTIYAHGANNGDSDLDKLTLTFTISEKDLSTEQPVTPEKREFLKAADKLDKMSTAKDPTSICRNLLKLAEYYATGHGVEKNLKKSEEFFMNAILCAGALYSKSTRNRKIKEFIKRKSEFLEEPPKQKSLSSRPRAHISKHL